MRVKFLILTLALLPAFLIAQNIEETFIQANEKYTQEKYYEAIDLYESIAEKGYESYSFYFNLGNAYYKTGEIAPAILNFERAKKLDPSNEDVLFNIKIANLQISDRVTAEPDFVLISWWKSFLVNRSTNGWAKWAIALAWLCLVLMAVFIFIPNSRLKKIAFIAGIFVLFVSLVSLALSYQQLRYDKDTREGIIFVTNVYVKSEPAESSTDMFILREGTKVGVVRKENDWYQIKLPDGKVGWLTKESIAVI